MKPQINREWVSIEKDGFPEKNGEYLVYFEAIDPIRNVTLKGKDIHFFCDGKFLVKTAAYRRNILAWMELPPDFVE